MNKIINKFSCSGVNCFNDDFFNKSLSTNCAHVAYDNLSIEQNPNIIFHMNNLISEIKPDIIIEIGTFAGGLTTLLRDLLQYNNLKDSIIYTYDILKPQYLIDKNLTNIVINVKNLFTEDYQNLISDELLNLINNSKRTIVFCDGGNKKQEFNIISKIIKRGDVIMAHDYANNIIKFNDKIKNKFWNWVEIQESDIVDVSKKMNLIPFMQESFDNVAWVCKIKK
jgi:predicted O-methyltransferase YrrM